MIRSLVSWLFAPRKYTPTTGIRVPVMLQNGEVYIWITDLGQGIVISVEDVEDLIDRMEFVLDAYIQDPKASVVSLRSPE